ncbi:MAG: HD domain-containing protein [Candidatus Hydrogenedentes bacterium]|nr:HD domain-containing protein [Candidatus Hydrogenedentota bacterium]
MSRTTPPGAPTAFFPVNIGSLRDDLVTGFSLYLPGAGGAPPVLYRDASLPFSPEARERLVRNAVDELLVPRSERRAWLKYTETILPAYLADQAVPVRDRATLLYESAQTLVQEALSSPDTGALVEMSRHASGSMAEFLLREPKALHELMQLTSYDYYTYTHSVNVFVYSVSLAGRLGMPAAEMDQFAHGALLHDIGKRRIDAGIVNAKGGLTDAQWEQMKQHPTHGYEILRAHGEASELALDVTRHHHEKLNGRGYPDGLAGEEISPWARITTIADIFDALTTKRSYKDAMDTFLALGFMKDKMWDEIDRDFFRVFVSMLARDS